MVKKFQDKLWGGRGDTYEDENNINFNFERLTENQHWYYKRVLSDFKSLDLISIFQAESEIKKFITDNDSFENYKSKVEFFHTLPNEISSKCVAVVSIGLFEMDRNGIINQMIDAAVKLKDTLIQQLVKDYQAKCKQ